MTLYLPVGPPGSGKTTMSRIMAREGQFPESAIVSPDEFRVALSDDVRDQDCNEQVFDVVHQIVRYRLMMGRDVFLDATNLLSYEVLRTLEEVETNPEQNIILLVPKATEDVIRRRNESRKAERKRVPDEVMDLMFNRFLNFDWEIIQNHPQYDQRVFY